MTVLTGPIPELETIAVRITDPIPDEPPDIIPGLLPRQGQLVIVGETNIGKSLCALEICSALTTERPLWGELQPTMKARRILYVLGEHYTGVIQRLHKHTNLPMSPEVWLLGPEMLKADKWLVANGRPNMQGVEKLAKWAQGCDLVVFDPLAAFVTGIDVENDNVQMRLTLDMMSQVCQTTGASCLVLAHQGKPSIGKDGQEFKRKSYRTRGASAIEDAATNIFYFDQSEGDSEVAQSRTHKLFTLKLRKYKGTAPEEYRLMRDPVTLTHTLMGSRPYVELRRVEIAAKVARLQSQFPLKPLKEVIDILRVTEGVSEDTIRRSLAP